MEAKLQKKPKRRNVLSRFRIGHTRITHFYLLKEEQPMCHASQTAHTIIHIFIECIDLAPSREKIMYERTIKKN